MNLLDILNLLRGKANTAFNDRMYGDLEAQNQWARGQRLEAIAKGSSPRKWSDSQGYSPSVHMDNLHPEFMDRNLKNQMRSLMPDWNQEDGQDLEEIIKTTLRARYNSLMQQRKQM